MVMNPVVGAYIHEMGDSDFDSMIFNYFGVKFEIVVEEHMSNDSCKKLLVSPISLDFEKKERKEIEKFLREKGKFPPYTSTSILLSILCDDGMLPESTILVNASW